MSRATETQSEISVLLVGNYKPDEQHSMLQYAAWLHRELASRGVRVKLIQPRKIAGWLAGSSPFLRKWLGYIDKLIAFPSELLLHAWRYDVVHICDHSNAHYCTYVARRKLAITCHDLFAVRAAIGELEGQHTGRTGQLLQAWILSSLKKIDFVACISEPTANDVRRLVGERRELVTIPNALAAPYFRVAPAEADRELAGTGLAPDCKFFLHVGSNSFYKNRVGVIRLFHVLAHKPQFRSHRLALAGPPPTPEMADEIAKSAAGDRIVVLANPSVPVLRALYNRADALLFISLLEGFGWPVIEAQACGCAVVTSNVEPMASIAGPAALLVSPTSPNESADRIEQNWDWLQSKREASIRNTERFAPAKIVPQYLAFYERVAAADPAP